ncbi:beta strand repeat-containing protein [Zavarzinia sp. CC-PAN008]|uniref:beta strand repeat-containing protein n=1 Tax=Zavarzinia sp. CC-PAN008 TaxID=3243332 RepID=UPI003F7487DE
MATFTGSVGVDSFIGGVAADLFNFQTTHLAGTDTVAGGGGAAIDQLRFTTAGTVAAGAFARVSGIELITLANGANTLTLTDALVASATGAVLSIAGNMGNDSVDASALTGGNAIDITGSGGVDTVIGGLGADTFRFTATALTAADRVTGGGGTAVDQLVLTSAGSVALAGVTGIERITLANGNNTVILNDAFVGSANGDVLTITGNMGNDLVNGASLSGGNAIDVTGSGGSDTFLGGLGADIFRFTSTALTAADRVTAGGGAAVDQLVMLGPGTQVLTGVSGIERIVLTNGNNTMVLSDALVGSAHGAVLTIAGNMGNDIVNGAGLTGPNAIDFTGSGGADTVIGGLGADIFRFTSTALTASDQITAGGGGAIDQLVMLGAGTQVLNGVRGIEQVVLANGTNAMTLNDTVLANNNGSLTILGGTGNDIVNASAVTNQANRVIIVAGSGNDTLAGGGGDTFSGGDGQDLLRTNGLTQFADDGTYLGGNGNDRIEYNVGALSPNSPLLGGGADRDTLFDLGNHSANINLAFVSSDQTSGDFADIRSFENVDWSQSSGGLTATGSTGVNTILGGAGLDRINGNGGADTLDGGANQDVLVGSGTAIAIVNLAVVGGDQTIADEALVRNFEAVDWSLSSGSLIASGTNTGDVMIGGSGTDSLTGGLGADTLTGGASADVFRYLVREGSTDVLTDFLPGTDKLAFQTSAFDFNGETFNVTVTTTTASMFSVAGADLIRLNGVVEDAAGVAAFLNTNGTGSDGEGVFVLAQTSGGRTFIYHVADAGTPIDIVRIADLGAIAPDSVSTTDFVFF